MKNLITRIALASLLMLLLVALWYGAWNFESWFNWTLGYENDVTEQLAPLLERIEKLEHKVDSLHTDIVVARYSDVDSTWYSSWIKIQFTSAQADSNSVANKLPTPGEPLPDSLSN